MFAIQKAVLTQFLNVVARRPPQPVLQSLHSFLIEILEDLAEVPSVFEIGEREDRESSFAFSVLVVGDRLRSTAEQLERERFDDSGLALQEGDHLVERGPFELEQQAPKKGSSPSCATSWAGFMTWPHRVAPSSLKGPRRKRSWKRFGMAGLNSSSAPR